MGEKDSTFTIVNTEIIILCSLPDTFLANLNKCQERVIYIYAKINSFSFLIKITL